MKIKLIELITKDDLDVFLNMKTKCINMHGDYAESSNIIDTESHKYNNDDAKKHINDGNYKQFIIEYNGYLCGIIEYNILESDVKDDEVCYLNIIYIKDEFRNLGIASKIIKDLKDTYKTIELEVWYSLPAEELYKKLGFKTMYKHMILE